MQPEEHLLIFGASARAAAFSALRAGLRPWCADLFADRDLVSRCPVRRVPPQRYPEIFLEISGQGPPGAWMYTGGLENRPNLVHRITSQRLLWGNSREALALARSPYLLSRQLQQAGIPCPRIATQCDGRFMSGRWLAKSLRGSGGAGIGFVSDQAGESRTRGVFFQEYIDGDPCSAVYVGRGTEARLLGVSLQLVGQEWLHAAPFHYCGSIGPLALKPGTHAKFEQIGRMLVRLCGLRGLFGVDCVLQEGIPWVIEVNPRYPASVEVLEHATVVSALALHRHAFEADASEPPLRGSAGSSLPSPPLRGRGAGGEGDEQSPAEAPHPRPLSPEYRGEGGEIAAAFLMKKEPVSIVGKAILFARSPLHFPKEGSWLPALDPGRPIHELPAYADIPEAGEIIEAGKPILTLFARAATVAECGDSLRRKAAALDSSLFAT